MADVKERNFADRAKAAEEQAQQQVKSPVVKAMYFTEQTK
jgi:hypothetical protein